MTLPALPTAAIADACVRLNVVERAAGLRPAFSGPPVVGRVLPVHHSGSVDVFFEALQEARTGDILVIDNEGRLDEGCIGDLTALEAKHHGAAAVVVDGCHRDSAALRALGLPVWSRGAFAFGPRQARPRRLDALTTARVASFSVHASDVVAADDDGVVFVSAEEAPRVWELAARIQRTEADQARRAQEGEPLCQQFAFPAFLAKRKADPAVTFRTHLRELGKSIEE